MTVQLIEYPWTGSKWASSGTWTASTFSFSPDPDTVTKDCQVDWTVRKIGLSATWPKSKYRYKRSLGYTFTGGCSGTKRCELEFYGMRNSKFKLTGLTNMMTVEPYSERSTTFPADKPWSRTSKPTLLSVEYVIIESITFKQESGKNDWFTYSIKLTVVDSGLVS